MRIQKNIVRLKKKWKAHIENSKRHTEIKTKMKNTHWDLKWLTEISKVHIEIYMSITNVYSWHEKFNR